MLVLSYFPGDSTVIDSDILIHVLRYGGDMLRLLVRARPTYPVTYGSALHEPTDAQSTGWKMWWVKLEPDGVVCIGDDVRVMYVNYISKHGHVKIGIDAPRKKKILRLKYLLPDSPVWTNGIMDY